MAQSLAFWFARNELSKQQDSTSIGTKCLLPDVDLHFNYWSLPNTKYDYLDIGVKLTSNEASLQLDKVFSSLNFYLPFHREDVEYHYELGELVCKEDELIPAIFNGELLSKDVYRTGQYELRISNLPRPLRVITQIQEGQEGSFPGVKISQLNDELHKGIQLSFPVALFALTNRKTPETTDSINSSDDANAVNPDRYIRFRIVIKQGKGNPLSSKESRQGAWLTGNFERDEIVDFRVNESRNLPGTVRAQLFENSNVKQVHFFLIRDSSTDLKISHTSYKRCRILEHGLWNSYLLISSSNGMPFSNDKNIFRHSIHWVKRQMGLKSSKPAQISENDRTLIYHWNEKVKDPNECGLDHFAAFSKFTSTRPAWLHLARFAMVVFLIGTLGSYCSNFIPRFDVEEPCLSPRSGVGVITEKAIHSGADVDNSVNTDSNFSEPELPTKSTQCAENNAETGEKISEKCTNK